MSNSADDLIAMLKALKPADQITNQTANQAYSVCLVTSAATQLSGVIKWVAR